MEVEKNIGKLLEVTNQNSNWKNINVIHENKNKTDVPTLFKYFMNKIEK